MDRFASLSAKLTQIDSSVNIEALLDALQVFYDECNTAGMKKTTNVPEFLQRYGKVLAEIQSLRPNRSDFDTVEIIGRGAFGEVQLVQHKQTKSTYAMKCLSKFEMLKRSDTAFYWQEREVMALSSSDWIVGLHFAFQDEKYLYLVMDFVPGGDLVTLISKHELTEDMVRFYMAESVMAVNSLHSLGYIHRDIKPDNMLLDAGGHVKLADFGTCIRVGKDGLVRSDTAIGTPDYISPEVLESQNGGGVYGVECDWWSIGVMMFELIYGETPFYSESLLGTYGQIMNHKNALKFPESEIASDISKDLMKKFITGRDERLGKRGVKEIQDHPFFKSIDWANLRSTRPPVVPEVKSATDTSNFEDIDTEHTHNEYFPTPKTFSGHHLPFIGYTFARQNNYRIVAADGTQLPQPAASAAASTPALAGGGGDEELVQQVTTLEREKARLKSEFDSLSKKLELEVEARKLAETELKANNKKAEKVAREQASAVTVLKEIEKKNQDLEKSIAMMKLEVKEANRRVEEETKARKRAQDQLAEARENAEDASVARELKKQLEEAKKKLQEATEKHEDEVSDLQHSIDAANKSLKDLQVKHTELEKQYAVADLEIKELTTKLHSASSTKADGSKKLEDVENQVADLKKKLDAAQDEASAASERARHASQEIQTLQKSLAQEQAQRASLQEELAASEKAKAVAESEVRGWSQKYQHATEQLAELKSEASTKETLHRSNSEIAQSEANAKEVESLKSQVQELAASRDKLRSTVSELEHKLSMSQIDLKDSERQAEKATKSLKETQAEVEALKAKLDAKQSDFVDLREKAKQLEGSKSIMAEKIESINSLLETERSAHRELQNLYNTLAKSNVTTQIEIKELNRKLTHAESDLKNAESKLADAVAKLDEKAKSLVQAEQSLSDAEKARDNFKFKFEEYKLLYETDMASMADLEKKFAEAEKSITLLEIEVKNESSRASTAERDMEDLRQNATTQLAELQEQINRLTTLQESLEKERQRLESELVTAHSVEKTLQEDHTALKKKLSEIVIQSTQKEHALNLALEKLKVAPAGKQSNAASNSQQWMDKKKTRDQQQELRKIEKKLQEEAQLTTKLRMQIDVKEADNQELREQVEELTMKIEALERTHPKADEISLLSVASSQKKALEGWLKTPKEKNIKQGWKKRFVVVSALKLFVYDEEKDKGSEPQIVIDLGDVILVRKVNGADLIHCSAAEVECIFQLLYKKQGELNASAKLSTFVDPNEKFHASRGHEFVSTHFSRPTWCQKCDEFIYGIGKQGYCCRKCNYVCHKKDKCFLEVPPCMSDLEATQIFFMTNNSKERDQWIQGIMQMKALDSSTSPGPSRRGTVSQQMDSN